MSCGEGVTVSQLEREIGVTADEFARSLALAHSAWTMEGPGRFRLQDGEITLRIDVRVAPSRRLGLFELPVLQVRYLFEGGTAGERRALLARLDLAMQRGGG
ncbi:MAG: hypothetical protein JNJ44_03920 [Zoogloeaceae bacterium]|nr:hypothetical protein [Zoogloeaceae bacterium]